MPSCCNAKNRETASSASLLGKSEQIRKLAQIERVCFTDPFDIVESRRPCHPLGGRFLSAVSALADDVLGQFKNLALLSKLEKCAANRKQLIMPDFHGVGPMGRILIDPSGQLQWCHRPASGFQDRENFPLDPSMSP